MWTSELHGAVAHASQDEIIGKLESVAGHSGGGHRFQIRNYELRIRKNENGEHRTSSGALGRRDKTKQFEVTPHFLHKDERRSRG
jgi:hypothetical protein